MSSASNYKGSALAALAALRTVIEAAGDDDDVRVLQSLDDAIGDVADRFSPGWPDHDAPAVTVVEVDHPGEMAAGLWPYSDTVRVEVASGNPGGEPGEFTEALVEFLREWFDGAAVGVDLPVDDDEVAASTFPSIVESEKTREKD